jgi:hypothetical protein
MILDGIDIKVGENSTLAIHKKDDTSIRYTFTYDEKATLNIK